MIIIRNKTFDSHCELAQMRSFNGSFEPSGRRESTVSLQQSIPSANDASVSGAVAEAAEQAGAERHEKAASANLSRAAASTERRTPKRKNRSARQFWVKQLHSWHWISAAISLAGMFVFALTGITLNHASTIAAEPRIVATSADLPQSMVELLRRSPRSGSAPLPEALRSEVEQAVGIDAGSTPAEWSEAEVYVAVPGPGSDAWVSIDRASGAMEAERTDRGWVSFFNDLHKGRNTGIAWFWLIDVLAVACVIFTFTGLLLLQLHARHRPSTWPLVGLGTAGPLIIILFFMHM